jgi:hypothetical protein
MEMTDFWTVIGRMVSDKTYLDGVVAVCTKVATPAGKAVNKGEGANIDPNAYREVREAVLPGLGVPVSLGTLGELVIAVQRSQPELPPRPQSFRDALKAVSERVVAAPSSAPVWCAIGACIVDGNVRTSLAGGGFDTYGFDALGGDVQTYLMTLCKDAEFGIRSDEVCGIGWKHGCFVKAAYYEGYCHPVPTP